MLRSRKDFQVLTLPHKIFIIANSANTLISVNTVLYKQHQIYLGNKNNKEIMYVMNKKKKNYDITFYSKKQVSVYITVY